MRFLTTICTFLLALLTTLTTAQVNQCTAQPTTPGHCTTLTWNDATTSSSTAPTTVHCQTTCSNIFSDPGDWQVDFTKQPTGYIDTIIHSPCGFAVGRGAGEPNDYRFLMANQDIANILNDVTTRFAGLHGGRVSANGTMVCDGKMATWFVKRIA
ncbi:hypothetical protein BDV96DRAFT_572981 [Lophiotrema nucula]|uniref:Ecp2 effector protein-like domain-containing protein n=1 Tax=Lophiotrema nucula TaxID=690887 RepID=A0A6A5ZCA8_9PLEO|nr:hypothetical protein BDV96DRAFT_572981 [Lophiotrema nucula]